MSSKYIHSTLAPHLDPDRKPRKCISCSKMFDSKHKGNRMCENCRRRPEVGGVSYSSYQNGKPRLK